jgi:16S rRNA (cytidine1402-2'-O)-methyltransferase
VASLLVVGTPLGNLEDLSPRAIRTLREVSLILCEDTRHSSRLLRHFGIETATSALHEHNEDERCAQIIDRIQRGEDIALISDAGLPVLSDPGFPLVRMARARGVRVEVVPGPFAAAVALAGSGIAPTPFAFFGFPPHRQGERSEFYRRVAAHRMTAIVYESPLRTAESLRDAMEALGDVDATVSRELTKLHEEHLHGRISELIARLEESEPRGEITIVFAAAEEREHAAAVEIRAQFQKLRDEGMKRSDAVRLLSERHGLDRKELYKTLLD